MTPSLILFIAVAVALVLVLAWVARPPKSKILNVEEVFRILAEERHYARLPQILQALQEEDTEYLRQRGHAVLVNHVRRERKQIVIRYLDYLEEEFRVLIEASRILAKLAPQLTTLRELDRLKKNLQFAWCCKYLRLRLRLGMQPWDAFNTISDMAGAMTLQLEAAMAQLGEKAMAGGSLSLPLKGGSGRSL
jgi:hypothetical protein